MKRKLLIFLMGLIMLFSLNACEVYTYATTQDDIYVEADADVVRSNVAFDVVIQYGTPYFRDGVLLYYLYRDIYYYPFYYNNYWYVRAYRRPFVHFDTRPYFRPHKYDYRFSPGHYRGFDRPNTNTYYGRPNINNRRPDVNNRRPDVNNRRPNQFGHNPNVNDRRRPNNPTPDNRIIQPNTQRPQRTITPPSQNRTTPNRSTQSNRNGHFGGRR